MFEAFVIVCASTLSMVVDENTCIRASDSWGPYRTEENCKIRIVQMVTEIIDGNLSPLFFSALNNPEMIHASGFCEKLKGEAV